MRGINGYILKTILACFMLFGADVDLFAQFTFDLHYGAKANGKLDSLVLTRFSLNTKVDTGVRHFAAKEIFKYNKNGQLLETDAYTNSFNPDLGRVIKEPRVVIFKYNSKGNVVKMLSAADSAEYEYQSKALVHIKYYCCKNNKPYSVDSIKLDKTGKVVERGSDIGQGRYVKTYYKYNSNGFIAEESTLYSDGSNKRRILYNYDNNANLSNQFTENSGDTYVNTYTYSKFDENNNWQVKNIYFEGKLTGVIERRIVYHK